MSDGFHVDLEALHDAADGVSGTLDQVRTRKVSDIACDKAAVGHDRLADAISGFCDRWSRGVDNLATDAQEIAGRLTDCANVYEAADQQARDQLDQVLEGGGHDPAAR